MSLLNSTRAYIHVRDIATTDFPAVYYSYILIEDDDTYSPPGGANLEAYLTLTHADTTLSIQLRIRLQIIMAHGLLNGLTSVYL